jgi:hypothetical protein
MAMLPLLFCDHAVEEDVALAACAIANVDAIQIGSVGDALDFFLIGNLLDEFASLEIHNIQAVVGQVRHEQPAVLAVDGHVVQTASRALEGNRL